MVMLTVLIMMILIVTVIIMILPMTMNTEKLEAIEHYLKDLIEITANQKKLIIVWQKKDSQMEYMSRGDRYENLSPKSYLDMIRPYLRDLINDHKPTI